MADTDQSEPVEEVASDGPDAAVCQMVRHLLEITNRQVETGSGLEQIFPVIDLIDGLANDETAPFESDRIQRTAQALKPTALEMGGDPVEVYTGPMADAIEASAEACTAVGL